MHKNIKAGWGWLLVTLVTFLVYCEWKRITHLQTELHSLQALSRETERLREENDRLSAARFDTNMIIRLRQGQLPLLRLRGQIALLTAAVAAPSQTEVSTTNNLVSPAQKRSEEGQIKKSEPLSFIIASADLAPSGNTTVTDTLQTALWEALHGDQESLAALYSAKSKHPPTYLRRANLKEAFVGVTRFDVVRKIEYGSGMVNLFFNLERPDDLQDGQAQQGSIWLVPDGAGWKIEALGVSLERFPF